jgi:5-methylcytosine-specific restriction enzyme A
MSRAFYLSAFWQDLRTRALKRDGYRCTVPGCRKTAKDGRLIVDHIRTRPQSAEPTHLDVLSNLRTLCREHDNQVKEDRNGRRRSGGRCVVKGCDLLGNPVDPQHHWRRP